MTRDKVLRAIRLGLSRGQGAGLDAQAAMVLDAIEMAVALDNEEKAERPVDMDVLKADYSASSRAPRGGGLPLPTTGAVVGPDGGGLISTESESLASNPVRITSIRNSPGQRISMEKLIEVLHSNTPESIQVTRNDPQKGKVTVTLTRNVISDSMTNTVRLQYKHESMGDDMAAFVVVDGESGMPDLAAAMAEVRRRAEKLYEWRPPRIEPAAPPPPQFSFDSIPKLDIAEALAEERTAPDIGELRGRSLGQFRFGS